MTTGHGSYGQTRRAVGLKVTPTSSADARSFAVRTALMARLLGPRRRPCSVMGQQTGWDIAAPLGGVAEQHHLAGSALEARQRGHHPVVPEPPVLATRCGHGRGRWDSHCGSQHDQVRVQRLDVANTACRHRSQSVATLPSGRRTVMVEMGQPDLLDMYRRQPWRLGDLHQRRLPLQGVGVPDQEQRPRAISAEVRADMRHLDPVRDVATVADARPDRSWRPWPGSGVRLAGTGRRSCSMPLLWPSWSASSCQSSTSVPVGVRPVRVGPGSLLTIVREPVVVGVLGAVMDAVVIGVGVAVGSVLLHRSSKCVDSRSPSRSSAPSRMWSPSESGFVGSRPRLIS